MKLKTLLLLGLAIFNVAFLFSTNLSASECDYVDEEGYCVTIVDNTDDTPYIGENNDDTTDENKDTLVNEEKIEIEIDTEIPVIDEEYDNIGNIEEYNEKQIAVFKEEYLQIAENTAWLNGDEQCFISSRLNGSSYSQAYSACFTINATEGVKAIGDLITENKDKISNLFSQMNSDSFLETCKKIFESISNLFTSEESESETQ